MYATSTTQWGRIAISTTPNQVLRINDAGTGIEWGEPMTFLPANATRIAMGL